MACGRYRVRSTPKRWSKHPAEPMAYVNMGNALIEDGEFDAAEAMYHAGLRVKPAYANLHYALALLYNERGDKDSALKHHQLTFVKPIVNVAPYFGTDAPLDVLLILAAHGGNVVTHPFFDRRVVRFVFGRCRRLSAVSRTTAASRRVQRDRRCRPFARTVAFRARHRGALGRTGDQSSRYRAHQQPRGCYGTARANSGRAHAADARAPARARDRRRITRARVYVSVVAAFARPSYRQSFRVGRDAGRSRCGARRLAGTGIARDRLSRRSRRRCMLSQVPRAVHPAANSSRCTWRFRRTGKCIISPRI